MRLTMSVLGPLGLAAFTMSCAGRDTLRIPDPAGVFVTQQEYGENWPFTIERGELWCISPGNHVVFVANNVAYAVNDQARAAKRWIDIEGTIWRESPKIPGTRVPLANVIMRGLMFCDPDFVPVLVTRP